MSTTPDEQTVQTPRAWRELMVTLGRHVPNRLGEVERAGRRIRSLGTRRPQKAGGK